MPRPSALSFPSCALILLLTLLAPGLALAANAEGQLDTNFGPAHNGKVTVPFNVGGGLVDTAYGAAMQSGGRLIVAGRVTTAVPQVGIGLVRLLPSGYADSSFGGSGTGQTTVFLAGATKVLGMLVQPDDRFLVSGNTADNGSNVMFAIRFLPDGAVATA